MALRAWLMEIHRLAGRTIANPGCAAIEATHAVARCIRRRMTNESARRTDRGAAMNPRKNIADALASLLFLSALGFPASLPAQTVGLTCLGTETAQYNPGMTFTPQPVAFSVSGLLAPCAGVPLGVTSASYGTSGTANLSCEILSGVAPTPPLTVHWSDGTTSVIQPSTVVTQRPVGEVVRIESGQIVSGRFLGAATVRTVTLLQTQLDACSTTGVESVGGPVVLEIIKLL
ncbi:hypothetical protein LA76x_0621 [Lysobacter antibioticus]|uniref:Uncharacterized protein n=1 Tax=Lysobacter antibioticus TaxID=84531 RepID=A0A0S2F5G3_LYSAN|nr:hypothetical protein LA76x_0621 [Lysobacter antibioticus]